MASFQVGSFNIATSYVDPDDLMSHDVIDWVTFISHLLLFVYFQSYLHDPCRFERNFDFLVEVLICFDLILSIFSLRFWLDIG